MPEAVNDLVSSFTIAELTGDKRTIILTGRGLPYRPFTLKGGMRNSIEWYPGNPIGVLQVYGANEDPTTINGMWKDIFLGQVGQTAPVSVDGTALLTAADVCDLFQDVRRKGQELEVTWLSRTRRGIISSFEEKWDNGHDVAFSIDFAWLSQGETLQDVELPQDFESDLADAPNQIRAMTDNLVDGGQGFLNFVDSSLRAIGATVDTQVGQIANFVGAGLSTSVNLIDDINNDTVGQINVLGGQIQALTDELDLATQSLAQFSSIPTSSTQRINGILDGMKLESDDLSDLWQNQADGGRMNQGGAFGGVLADRQTCRSQAGTAQETAALAAAQQQKLLTGLKSNVLAVFQARQDDDLRRVSQVFYDTPDHWQGLMIFNQLTSDQLDAGQIVIVPTNPPGNS